MQAILDYRMAQWAVEAFHDQENGRRTMERNPHLMEMLRDMLRATGASEAEATAALDGMKGREGE